MRYLLVFLMLLPQAIFACGQSSDCQIEGGTYRIALPDGDGPFGAVIFYHGWQGTAQGVMRNRSILSEANKLGVAVIAPQGINKTWSYPGSPDSSRDEFAFTDALLADIADHFPIDMDKIMVSGFSMGGSMAWNVACYRGENIAGFAPIAGAYWDPVPTVCPSPMPVMIHVHGKADTTVPISGRPIGIYRQSDVYESLAQWEEQGACKLPNTARRDGALVCQRVTCSSGVLELCLHEGGHSIRTEWVVRAWKELSEIKGWGS